MYDMINEKQYYEKYLKYKKKYLELKEQQGGAAMTHCSEKELGTPKINGICGFLINMQDERVFLIYLPFPHHLHEISSQERNEQINLLKPEIKSLSKSDFCNYRILKLFDGDKYLHNILKKKFEDTDKNQIQIYRNSVLSTYTEMITAKGKMTKYGVYAYLIKNDDDEQFIIYVTIDNDKKRLNGPSKFIATLSVGDKFTAYETENSIIFVKNENKFNGNKELVNYLKRYTLHHNF